MVSSTSTKIFPTSSSSEEEEACSLATQLLTATTLLRVLKSAIELGLLELIKKAGHNAFVSPADLAAQLSTGNPQAAVVLDRILRLLAANKILNCISVRELPHGGVERRYSLTPVCKFLTKNDDGVSMAPMFLLNQDKVLIDSWDNLKDAIFDGVNPFKKAYGMSVFEYSGTDPRFRKVFNEAMSNQSTIIMKKILETYDGFEGLKSLVDVGGGTGETLNMIISKYPSIKGINFDLPHIVEDAPSYPGLEHVGGDMFVSVPKGDAIFMKSICHDWTDEHCSKLLKNCYESLEENGKLIVAEFILPEVPDNSLATKSLYDSDVTMLTHPGGKERTEMEFQDLAKEAGFKAFNKVCGAQTIWIMELRK